MQIISKLPVSERARLKEMLEGEPPKVVMEQFLEEKKFTDGGVCPYCGGHHIRRNGHQKSTGRQKFICADCGRSFSATTDTLFSGSPKDISVWRKYIECMSRNMTIDQCAEACGIVHSTAFFWRHKILDLMAKNADKESLGGIIEADETYLPESFKGNHKPFEDGSAGRDSRKRGSGAKKKGLSDGQVCVPCAVDRKGGSVAKVAKKGKVSAKALGEVIGNKIDGDATICSDGDKSYKRFAKSVNADLVQIKGGKSVKGIYHIQHINNYHSQLKDFLKPFRGVATKYLNNYLIWNKLAMQNNHKVQQFAEQLLKVIPLVCATFTSRGVILRDAFPFLV